MPLPPFPAWPPGLRAPAARPPLGDGEEGAECWMAGRVAEVAAGPDASVSAGDARLVVSAMKMETAVAAPVSGTIASLAELAAGGTVQAGQIVATIAPVA